MSCTGFDGALGIGTAGAANTALSFTEVLGARDVNVSINSDKANTSDRATKWKSYTAAGVDLEVTATLTLVDGSSTQGAILSTIRTACIDRTTIKVGAFTSAIAASAEGVVFDCYVFSNDIAQPLSDGQTISVTFAPASGGTLTPDWVTLS